MTPERGPGKPGSLSMVTTPQRGRGRPPVGESTKTGHLHVKVDLSKKGRWVAAARADGLTLSAWCERTLDRAAQSSAAS